MTGNEWNDVKARLKVVEDLAIALAENARNEARIDALVDAIRAERKLAAEHAAWMRQAIRSDYEEK